MTHLDWNDPEEVRRTVAALRETWEDADAVATDMLRPARERELGPVKHRENYEAARGNIVRLLTFMGPDAEG